MRLVLVVAIIAACAQSPFDEVSAESGQDLAQGAAGTAQAAQPAPPVFRAGTDLVRVDVTVTQRGDEPVTDLTMADFEEALTESRASVTPEMEKDYEQIAARLKQDAAAIQPLGFISPGQLRSRGSKADV